MAFFNPFLADSRMSKNKKQQKAAAAAEKEVDPQTLFEQFGPALHFNEPKQSTRAEWFIIAEQVVPVTREYFWETVVSEKKDCICSAWLRDES